MRERLVEEETQNTMDDIATCPTPSLVAAAPFAMMSGRVVDVAIFIV